MIDFSKVERYRKEKDLITKKIEKEINSSVEWEEFFLSLNDILKKKHKMEALPTLHCAVSGIEFNQIRFWSLAYINNDFLTIYKNEISDKGIDISDLFSNNMVMFRHDNSDEVLRYNFALRNLNTYINNISNKFYNKESSLYKEYSTASVLYKKERDKINAIIQERFSEDKFQEKIMNKINEYFYLSPIMKIDFKTSFYHNETKMSKSGEISEIYEINFYIASYDMFRVLVLAKATFDIKDIERTIKFFPKLIDNSNVLSHKKVGGVNYLRTTLKKNLKKMVLKDV